MRAIDRDISIRPHRDPDIRLVQRRCVVSKTAPNRKAIRKVAGDRLREIRAKLTDLGKMERPCPDLIDECEATNHGAPAQSSRL